MNLNIQDGLVDGGGKQDSFKYQKIKIMESWCGVCEDETSVSVCVQTDW